MCGGVVEGKHALTHLGPQLPRYHHRRCSTWSWAEGFLDTGDDASGVLTIWTGIGGVKGTARADDMIAGLPTMAVLATGPLETTTVGRDMGPRPAAPG